MAKITLGRYMWERIHQVGVDTIFGVPGDFNLQFLDSIFEVEGLKWVGNQNELNAAYAADGYSRIKGVPGVFVTTHGVGELSALNGVAGGMSERVKMIHVVGQTTRAMQNNHMMIHHSIGNKPDHQQYNNASRGLRFAAAELWNIETAPAEIDRVIRECFIQSGPVYIFLPLDLSTEEVSVDLLQTPINIKANVDTTAQEAAVKAIKDALEFSKNPSILIDALAHRFNAVPETRELVSKLHVPFYSANMGKGLVDETDEMYVGVYNGEISAPGVAEAFKSSDLVVVLGYLPADTNSGGFSRELKKERTIEINPFDVVVKGQTFSNTHIKPLLASLISNLPSTPFHNLSLPKLPPPRNPIDIAAKHITQSWLWPRISQFLRPGDILIGETGTTVFGLCDIRFPRNICFQAQIYYGSIGYATAATLGAEIARVELESGKHALLNGSAGTNGIVSEGSSGRTILITGDGSMAMTIQEIGTMIKAGINPLIIVINNAGYTVERMIWGAQQPYNDIVPTTYSHLLPLFKHPRPEKSFHLAKTKVELDAVLEKGELKSPRDLQLVEIVVDKMDTAWRLGSQLAWRGEKSREYLTNEGFVDTYGGWGLDGGSNGTVKWS
ncbi:pyruvate decarboxylase [Lindgomyces ingoldianus]|uniref:Pyruvate decarboxylase n=1 Tax=Lindgomyces ingoldianus TaxID=673940 RepID=A0ACB6RCI2_9PLEO|nr:pyruvate decarboxylase [Lindgomyces ingoldianus]KAF2476964.1 pyruvate decarboxylase [Lindgomyces ingoldianus]